MRVNIVQVLYIPLYMILVAQLFGKGQKVPCIISMTFYTFKDSSCSQRITNTVYAGLAELRKFEQNGLSEVSRAM